MTPDLRPPRKYARPLPKWVIHVYLFVFLAMIGSGYYVFSQWKDTAGAKQEILQKQQAIVDARKRIAEFATRVNGLEASRTVRSSAEAWREGSTRVAALQTAAVAVVAEAQTALLDQAKKTPPTAKPTRVRGRMQPVGPSAPSVQLRNLSVEIRPDPDRSDSTITEMKMELSHNTDSRQLITALSAAFTPMKPAGLTIKNFKPEDRGTVVILTTTWRKVAAQ